MEYDSHRKGVDQMKSLLRMLFLPIRITITALILICSLLIRLSGKILSLAAGLILLLGLAVLTYSTRNALMVFALAFLISPTGLPMMAVGVLAVLNRIRAALCFG